MLLKGQLHTKEQLKTKTLLSAPLFFFFLCVLYMLLAGGVLLF